MKPSDKQIFLALVRTDLKAFLQYAFNTIYPGNEFMDNWHIDAILYCLEQSIMGKMPRLIINLPPRHLKSFITSVVLPAFILGLDPTAKIICISYSDQLAKTLSRDFKRLVESKRFRQVFPEIIQRKMTENEFATEQGGFRYATSVGGTLTGRGGDFIIIDDPIKADDVWSDKIRQSTNDWFKSTLLSRLDDKQRSVLILVMQRVHVNDLTGFVEGSGGFHKLSLPAIAVRDEEIPVSVSEIYCREEGEALHEEREGSEILARIRDQIGPHNFASQYQQRPDAPEGAMFKRKWFKLIDEVPAVAGNGYLLVSIDSASSISETADFSAFCLILSNDQGHFVLFSERGRWDYETLLAKARDYVRRYGRDVIFVVEAASSGISLIQSLRKSGLTCISHRPKDDKMYRASCALPIIHDGRVYILNKEGQNDWVEPLINELVSFPYGRFDDQVDSLVQVLSWAERRVNPGGSIYFM